MDKQVNAAIENALLDQQDKFNYEDEVADLDDECCEECKSQLSYYLRKDHR
jgi:hypothetical protein